MQLVARLETAVYFFREVMIAGVVILFITDYNDVVS